MQGSYTDVALQEREFLDFGRPWKEPLKSCLLWLPPLIRIIFNHTQFDQWHFFVSSFASARLRTSLSAVRAPHVLLDYLQTSTTRLTCFLGPATRTASFPPPAIVKRPVKERGHALSTVWPSSHGCSSNSPVECSSRSS